MDSPPRIPHGVDECRAESWHAGAISTRVEHVASEAPVALIYNGVSHAVMLATPEDLEDFGVGFSLSEGIVQHARQIHDCEISLADDGVCVNLTIAASCFAALKERRRNLAGRTGCGLCGSESLEQVFRPLPRLTTQIAVDPAALHRAVEQLAQNQPMHTLTGAIHAAALFDLDGNLQRVREDVGRHNALDKLIGTMVRARMPLDRGFVVLTSRASSEMVQKAATMGIAVLAAISAPTSMAIRIAEQSGVTLIGFVRAQRHAVYTHAGRIHAKSEMAQ